MASLTEKDFMICFLAGGEVMSILIVRFQVPSASHNAAEKLNGTDYELCIHSVTLLGGAAVML